MDGAQPVAQSTGLAVEMDALLARLARARSEDDANTAQQVEREINVITQRAYDLWAEAEAADKRGDRVAAAGMWGDIAHMIDGPHGIYACLRAGNAFLNEEGLQDRAHVALRFLEAAVRAGSARGHYLLGCAYFEGNGVPADYELAVYHLQQAAEGGEIDAHGRLGLAYMNGNGVPKDPSEGVRHWKLAAQSDARVEETGELLRAPTEDALAFAYQHGIGVERDLEQARYWNARAAADGITGADAASAELSGGANKTLAKLTALVVFDVATIATIVMAAQSVAWAALSILAAFNFWLAFRWADKFGVPSRLRIATKFRSALAEDVRDIVIGGEHWVICDGEFHHLSHDAGQRGLLYKADTGHDARHQLELLRARDRETLMMILPLALGACGFAPLLSAGHPWGESAVAICVLLNAGVVFREYEYRFGRQTFRGAMVLDPPPVRASAKDVEAQRAHGDARMATEAEALAAGNAGAVRRSSVHDQEF